MIVKDNLYKTNARLYDQQSTTEIEAVNLAYSNFDNETDLVRMWFNFVYYAFKALKDFLRDSLNRSLETKSLYSVQNTRCHENRKNCRKSLAATNYI